MANHSDYSESYGEFCMAAWCICLGVTILVFLLDVTGPHSCLQGSWDNLTVAFAALATLMYVTASVVYPLYFVRLECPDEDCEVRDLRITVSVCSIAGSLAYVAEVVLSRARPVYMATVPGLLKVAQFYVPCIIFGVLTNGSEYHLGATMFCGFTYALCFILTTLVVFLTLCEKLRFLQFERFVVVYTFLAVVLYFAVSVVWAVYCFHNKYGSRERPPSCPLGKCPWDSKVVVAVFSFVNLGLYATDLIISQWKCLVDSLTSVWPNTEQFRPVGTHELYV